MSCLVSLHSRNSIKSSLAISDSLGSLAQSPVCVRAILPPQDFFRSSPVLFFQVLLLPEVHPPHLPSSAASGPPAGSPSTFFFGSSESQLVLPGSLVPQDPGKLIEVF